MKRILDWLRGEPALVAAAITAGIGWAASKGFDLDETTVLLIWTAAQGVFGVAVRQQVTPTSKLEA